MQSTPSRIVPILLTIVSPLVAGLHGPSRPATTSATFVQSASTVELIGLTGQHRSITAAELAKMPHVDAEVSSHNVTGRYRGVPLRDLLRLLDQPSGEVRRGKTLATAISVEAADGYRVAFAIAEVDSGFSNKVIFLADAKNGAPLDTAEGPFRIIVPDEKRPARWSRKVVRIRLVAIE